jgi:Ca2+/Na+ antiporter
LFYFLLFFIFFFLFIFYFLFFIYFLLFFFYFLFLFFLLKHGHNLADGEAATIKKFIRNEEFKTGEIFKKAIQVIEKFKNEKKNDKNYFINNVPENTNNKIEIIENWGKQGIKNYHIFEFNGIGIISCKLNTKDNNPVIQKFSDKNGEYEKEVDEIDDETGVVNEIDSNCESDEEVYEFSSDRIRKTKCDYCEKIDNKKKIYCLICNTKVHEKKCSFNKYCLPCNVINQEEIN